MLRLFRYFVSVTIPFYLNACMEDNQALFEANKAKNRDVLIFSNHDGSYEGAINQDDSESPAFAPKDLEEGFAWLKKGTTTSRAYEVSRSGYRTKDGVNPEMDGDPNKIEPLRGYAAGFDKRKFLITRWHRVSTDFPCDMIFEYGDPSDPNQGTRSVLPRGCAIQPVASPPENSLRYSRYGVRNCDTEKVTFLGTRDIRTFIGAFGVRIDCKRGEYASVHQIWYHPDSNHPHKKVREFGTFSRIDSNGQYWFTDVFQQNYENRTEKEPSNEYEVNPPLPSVRYTAEGSIKKPGVQEGIAICSISDQRKFTELYLPGLFINYNTTTERQTLQGVWEPSFNLVGELSPMAHFGIKIFGDTQFKTEF